MPEKGNGSLLCPHSHPFTSYTGIKQKLFLSLSWVECTLFWKLRALGSWFYV